MQTLDAWNAPTGVLNAIQEFNFTHVIVLPIASFIKHLKMINSHFDINQRGGPKVATLLQYASTCGNVEVVDALLDANADPNVCDKEDSSPLKMASQKGHVQIVKKLLQKG